MYEGILLFFLLFWFVLILVFVTLASYYLGINKTRLDNYLKTAYTELTAAATLIWIIFLFSIIGIIVYYYNNKKLFIGRYFFGIILFILIIILGVISASAVTNMRASPNFDTRITDYYYAYVNAILATIFTFIPLILIIIYYIYSAIKK